MKSNTLLLKLSDVSQKQAFNVQLRQ